MYTDQKVLNSPFVKDLYPGVITTLLKLFDVSRGGEVFFLGTLMGFIHGCDHFMVYIILRIVKSPFTDIYMLTKGLPSCCCFLLVSGPYSY